MLVVRDVFQAKYGKGGELVELFKEGRKLWEELYGTRILTDASGPFFTVVTEREAESFADWEESREKIFSLPDFNDWFARMQPLVENGRREFYNVE
jgi:hypothetical protein